MVTTFLPGSCAGPLFKATGAALFPSSPTSTTPPHSSLALCGPLPSKPPSPAHRRNGSRISPPEPPLDAKGDGRSGGCSGRTQGRTQAWGLRKEWGIVPLRQQARPFNNGHFRRGRRRPGGAGNSVRNTTSGSIKSTRALETRERHLRGIQFHCYGSCAGLFSLSPLPGSRASRVIETFLLVKTIVQTPRFISIRVP